MADKLPEIPDGWYELERPQIEENSAEHVIVLKFSDPVSREWWRKWLKGRHCFNAFGEWVDFRR